MQRPRRHYRRIWAPSPWCACARMSSRDRSCSCSTYRSDAALALFPTSVIEPLLRDRVLIRSATPARLRSGSMTTSEKSEPNSTASDPSWAVPYNAGLPVMPAGATEPATVVVSALPLQLVDEGRVPATALAPCGGQSVRHQVAVMTQRFINSSTPGAGLLHPIVSSVTSRSPGRPSAGRDFDTARATRRRSSVNASAHVHRHAGRTRPSAREPQPLSRRGWPRLSRSRTVTISPCDASPVGRPPPG